jgi:hypothetical protein
LEWHCCQARKVKSCLEQSGIQPLAGHTKIDADKLSGAEIQTAVSWIQKQESIQLGYRSLPYEWSFFLTEIRTHNFRL